MGTECFGSIVDHAIGGGWGKEESFDGSEKVAVIRGTDFSNIASLNFDAVPRRFEEKNKAERRKLRHGDIVLEISGGSPSSDQSTGRTLLITDTVLSHFDCDVIPASFCRLVRLKQQLVDSRYAYYHLQEMYQSRRATAYEQQSTGISNFQFTHFLEAEKINLPPLTEQRAIAGVLGSFDNKIDLNRRMNQSLQAMARALFQSWFVDFDPVRAKAAGQPPAGMDPATADLFPAESEDSALGDIPKGWKVSTLGDVLKSSSNGLSVEEMDGNAAYIGLEHMPRRSIALDQWGTAAGLQSNKNSFNRGDILFGKLRPYFHKVGIAPIDGVCSTDILVLAPKTPAWFGFAFCHCISDKLIAHATALSNGAKMPRTKWSDLRDYKVVLPPKSIAEDFTARLWPLFDRIIANIHESRTLSALRDTLLPHLLSGKLSVDTLLVGGGL